MEPKRTILRTIDGVTVVRPKAPDSVVFEGGQVGFLSPAGKLRWDAGLPLDDYTDFHGWSMTHLMKALG